MIRSALIVFGVVLVALLRAAYASDFDTVIPIVDKGAVTYYVAGRVEGYGDTDFMVDTGSGYTAINQEMLEALRRQGKVEYVHQISGILANGSRTKLSVFKIASIDIGGKCSLRDVTAVVLPGATRNILGLSALKKIAPFALSIDPPRLLLSNCGSEAT